jgi:hypothetical protein
MSGRAVLVAVLLLGALTAGTGCASDGSAAGVYYGNGGTVHSDAYPSSYEWGRSYRYGVGRPGIYRY